MAVRRDVLRSGSAMILLLHHFNFTAKETQTQEVKLSTQGYA